MLTFVHAAGQSLSLTTQIQREAAGAGSRSQLEGMSCRRLLEVVDNHWFQHLGGQPGRPSVCELQVIPTDLYAMRPFMA